MFKKWLVLAALSALSGCATHEIRCSGPLHAINAAQEPAK